MALYRGPWFPLFQDDFVSGCGDLATEEIGAYILLLGYAWNKGGIPTSILRLAVIAKLPRDRMEIAWEALSSKFTLSPHDPSLLSNRRLEIVREEMRLRSEARKERSKKAASARWASDAPSTPQALPQASAEDSLRICLDDAIPIPVPNSIETDANASAGPPKKVTAKVFAFDADLSGLARSILAAVWSELAKTPYSATITKTEWGKRNKRTALDLATLKKTPEECLAAWQSASARLGSPVRMLNVVQDEMGRLAAPAKRKSQTSEIPVYVPGEFE